jgi:hypothetical protein
MGGAARSRTRVWGLRVVSYFRTGPMRRLEGVFLRIAVFARKRALQSLKDVWLPL